MSYVEGNNIITEFHTQTKPKIFKLQKKKKKKRIFFNSLVLTNKKQEQAGPASERWAGYPDMFVKNIITDGS